MTSHRGVGAVPVEHTMHEEADMVEDISGIDDVIELMDSPNIGSEVHVVNPDFGQVGFGQRVKGRVSAPLVLETIDTPWPRSDMPTESSARHGSAEQVMQLPIVAQTTAAEDEPRSPRRMGNRTRSPSPQQIVSIEHLKILNSRIVELERSHEEISRNQKELTSTLGLVQTSVDELRVAS